MGSQSRLKQDAASRNIEGLIDHLAGLMSQSLGVLASTEAHHPRCRSQGGASKFTVKGCPSSFSRPDVYAEDIGCAPTQLRSVEPAMVEEQIEV